MLSREVELVLEGTGLTGGET